MNGDHRDTLLAVAREAAANAYAPYSNFHVGAALLMADGTIVTGANVENASYGLSLCAEAVAVAKVLSSAGRGRVEAVAVTGGAPGAMARGARVTPCGRCRQMLTELAQVGGSDPVIWCDGGEEPLEVRLSELLPHAFGPANLG